MGHSEHNFQASWPLTSISNHLSLPCPPEVGISLRVITRTRGQMLNCPQLCLHWGQCFRNQTDP